MDETTKYILAKFDPLAKEASDNNDYEMLSALNMAVYAITHLVDLKSDLQTEIHKLESIAIDKTSSDDEKVKTLIVLECYSRVLNQLN